MSALRQSCRHPEACVAGKRGPCRACHDLRGHAERMRKMNADPEFAKANAERMRKLHADPEFAKAKAERMRKLHADPEHNRVNQLYEQMKTIWDKHLNSCAPESPAGRIVR